MINWIWSGIFCFCAIVLTFTSGGDAAMEAMLAGAQEAVTLSISLAGSYLLFLGLLGVAKKAGLMDALSRKLRPVTNWLCPNAGRAGGAITLNLAANMLGMGNAATPFGLEAMRLLDEQNPVKGRATHAMCMFICVNASALQLIPTTLIGLRASYGSPAPTAIVVPSLIASIAASAAAIVLCKLLAKRA